MKHHSIGFFRRVIILTALPLSLTSCYFLRHYEASQKDECKNHAYIQQPVRSYLSRRFPRNAPVRLAVIPFTVPANITSWNDQQPGFGTLLARELKKELLKTQLIPIVELFERLDWPAKRHEFHTGNHGALGLARHAGYDLVLVGFMDHPASMHEMTTEAKLIDVHSGTTIWYGQSIVENTNPQAQRDGPWWNSRRIPSRFPINSLLDDTAQCIARSMEQEYTIRPH